MEETLVTLLITAIALIFVAVVLYQRIYKITRNGIYVENGKKKIDELADFVNKLEMKVSRQNSDLLEKINRNNSRIIDLTHRIAYDELLLDTLNRDFTYHKGDFNTRFTEQQNSIGSLKHDKDIITRAYNDLSARFEKIEAYIFTNPKPVDVFGIEAESVNPKKEK